MSRFDLLVCPISSNPSVTAIICHQLARAESRIVLLPSKETEAVAIRLKDWLKGRGFGGVRLRLIDPFDPGEVTLPSTGVDDSVLLDLTAGTKVTTIALFRHLVQKHSDHLTTSYLMPDHQLLLQQSTVEKIEVGQSILRIDDIFALQFPADFSPRTPVVTDVMADVLTVLALLHRKKEGIVTYFRWKKQRLWKFCQSKPFTWRTNEELERTRLKFDTSKEMEELGRIFGEGNFPSVGDLARPLALDPRDWCEFMSSFWLEYYVYEQLLSAGFSPRMNVVSAEPEFEVDVIFVHANDLYTVSCTTIADDLGSGSRSKIKYKLFEIITRSRQLGGLKSRSIVVSLAKDVAGLQEELTGLQIHQVTKVFGRKHLADLGGHIKRWVKNSANEFDQEYA